MYSTYQDPHEDAPKLPVSGTPYCLRIMDTMLEREVCKASFITLSRFQMYAQFCLFLSLFSTVFLQLLKYSSYGTLIFFIFWLFFFPQNTVKDFAEFSKKFLQESMKWAPNAVRSHLIHYVLNMENASAGIHQHSGLALATESVLNYAGYNKNSAPLGVSLSRFLLILVFGFQSLERRKILVVQMSLVLCVVGWVVSGVGYICILLLFRHKSSHKIH